MAKKKVTLSLEEKEYLRFQKYCEENAMNFSKKIDLLIREFLNSKKLLVLILFFATFLLPLSVVSAVEISSDTFECGTFSCGSGWEASWSYSGSCELTSLGGAIGSYHMRGESGCDATREFDSSSYSDLNVTFWATAQSLESGEHCYYYYYNGSSYFQLLDLTNGDDDADHDYYSFNVTGYGLSSGSEIRMEAPLSGADYCSIDNISIQGFGVADNNAPNFTNYVEDPTNNSQYLLDQVYNFNVTVNDDNLHSVWYEFEGVNYTDAQNISNVYFFNRTGFASGNYIYYWWANDTNGNLNRSGIRVYFVEKQITATFLVFDKISPQTYSTSINASCLTNSSEASATLYRDSVNVTIEENNQDIVLAAGTYNYVCNVTDTQNYSASTNSSIFIIDKAGGDISLYLNSVSSDLNINYPATSNISAATIYGSLIIYLNQIDITTQNNLDVSRAAGYYNVSAISSGDENHTEEIATYYLTINKANTICSLSFDPSNSVVYETSVNISGSCNNPEAIFNFYRDGTQINSENGVDIVLGVGVYDYKVNVTETQNYSLGEASDTMTVTKASTTTSVLVDPASPIVYGTTSNFSCYNSVGLETILYVNDTDKTVEMNQNIIRAAGTYLVNCTFLGNQNYTESSEEILYIINKSPNSCGVLFNETTPLTYGNSFKVFSNCNSLFSLYRNGAIVSNNSIQFLAAGTYNFSVIRNDKQNYSNFYSEEIFVVDKAIPVVTLTNSDPWIISYGNQVIISYVESNYGDSDVVYNVFRDSNNLGSGETITLAFGNYSYLVNTTGGQNYTGVASLDINLLTVNKADPTLRMNIGVNPSLNEIYGTYTRATATETNSGDSDLKYNLTRNSVLVATSSPWEEQPLLILNVGTYVYTFNTTGGQNYSSGKINVTLKISKAVSDVNLYLNGTQSNLSAVQYENIDINATLIKGENEFQVYYNGSLVHNDTLDYLNTSVFSFPGLYNITVVYPDDLNFNSSFETFFVNVSAAPDTFGPVVTIISPENVVYHNGTEMVLNITSSDPSNVSVCWYNLDGGQNYTIFNCTNTTFNVSGDGNHTIFVFSNDSLGNIGGNFLDFVLDEEGINIFIIEPSGVKTTRNNLPVRYVVLGSNITCWYNVLTSLGGIVITNITLENCTNSSFNLSSDGDYLFNLFTNNTLGTFKSLSKSFSIDTTSSSSSSSGSSSSSSSGSGGGGGGSINPLVPVRTELWSGSIEDFVTNSVGIKKILTWTIKNTGTTYLNDCEFSSFGNNSDWITHTENKGLAAGEEYDIVFDVNIPEDVWPDKFNFGVSFVCDGANTTAEFNAEVTTKTLNFEILNIEREGEESVRVDYLIEDISGKDQDVELEFLLFDSGNLKVAELTENKFVGANAVEEYDSYLSIPSELEGQLKLLINVNSETYSGFVQENVVLGTPISGFTVFDEFGNSDTFISIALIVLFLSFMYLVIRKIRNRRVQAEENAKVMIREHKIKVTKRKKDIKKLSKKISKDVKDKVKTKKPKKEILKDIEKGGSVTEKQAEKEIELAKKFSKKK